MRKIIVVLGRSQDLGFNLINKLDHSHLSSWDQILQDYMDNDSNMPLQSWIEMNLDSYLERDIKTNNKPIIEMIANDSLGIYFVEAFDYNPDLKIAVLSCIIYTLNSLKRYNPKEDKLFYLCHDTHFGKPQLTEQLLHEKEMEGLINKIYEILDIEISLEKFTIATFSHEGNGSRIFSALEKGNKDKWIDFDIDALIKDFDKDKLLEQKKKIIDTFLPLAIDMHGLSQMSNNEKRKQYQEEIIQDINLNGDRIINEWNDIKKVLAIDSNEETLSEEYQLSQEQKAKIKYPLERGSLCFSKEEVIGLFKKDSWTEDEFLPKWLEQAVDILEKKIEGNSNQ